MGDIAEALQQREQLQDNGYTVDPTTGSLIPPTQQNLNEAIQGQAWNNADTDPDLLPPSLGGTASRQDLEDAGVWEDWVQFYSQSFGGGGVGEDNYYHDWTGYGGGELAVGGTQPGQPPSKKNPVYGGTDPNAPVDPELEYPVEPTDPVEPVTGGGSTPPAGGGGGGGTRDPNAVVGVGGTPDGNANPTFDIDPLNPDNWHGFGNSSNRDFYAMQAAAQRAQMFGDALRADVAAQNLREAERNRLENPAEAPDYDAMWAEKGVNPPEALYEGSPYAAPVPGFEWADDFGYYAQGDPSFIWNPQNRTYVPAGSSPVGPSGEVQPQVQ